MPLIRTLKTCHLSSLREFIPSTTEIILVDQRKGCLLSVIWNSDLLASNLGFHQFTFVITAVLVCFRDDVLFENY